MEDEEAFEKYGDTPLYFSHYYNFLFVFKSAVLDNGDQIFLQLVDEQEKSGASEFEIYLNFMLQYYPDKIKIRKLNHLGVVDIKDIKGNLDYVSYHWYLRK